ncbi:MAG: pilus assembly protein TadG-related protein [Actinomycetota bacterium]|nr:pilus assembly protein TadG-related protein [Actinomycetota bacterium]
MLVLAALLGIAALVVDGGNALLQRRNQQGVADAAALAAVKDLPGSTLNADAAARDYAGRRQNGADGSIVDQVVVTSTNTSSCDGGFGATTLAPASACVVVHTTSTGAFSQLLGIVSMKESARAIAQAAQVTGVGGWLPLGVRSGAFSYKPPTQLAIAPNTSSQAGGLINTPAGPDCKFYGFNQIADVIKGNAYGGADACPITIGQTVKTQTGGGDGNITNKGFDARIGSNTDSFSDVFGQDVNGNYYVKKVDSPRLGIMPIAQDTTGNWPLTGGATITVQGYVLVYIGDTTNPPLYPAYSGKGATLTIYLTPVNAPLPDSWAALIGDYSASNPSPIVYRLVS